MEFMPRYAPAAVLAFMLLCLALGLAGALLLYAAWTGKRHLGRRLFGMALAAVAGYFIVVVAVSLFSHEKVLARGEQKYFCEVDCHEAYSVADVKTTKAVGAPTRQAAARGTFYLVTLKVWFDEKTISSRRPRLAPLFPNPRAATVVDESGREFQVSREGQAALEQAEGKGIPFTAPIRPGESYLTTLVFDLPQDTKDPRLCVTTESFLTWFIFGHENSPFHKKVLFRLGPLPTRM